MYRILELNPQLEPFAGDIDLRMHLYRSAKKRILSEGQSLNDFANAHMYFGFHHVDGGWYYREWAPSAYQLYLEGEFNGWNQTSHPLTNLGNGSWELYLPGDDALWDGCKVKTVVDANLTRTEHIPLYARRVVQNKQNITFECEVVDDRKAFPWTDKGFTGEDELYIYEAHIGMAQEEGKVGSYREFADNILPRIHKAGYNTLQLMAIMEHPYYGSFGYQVSSFFAASSWFGKPEDLKYLVNKAHAMGIRVLLDVVHSHAVKNTAEGINMFDGTTWQFFHDGPKGDHPAWGTKCFDYGKTGAHQLDVVEKEPDIIERLIPMRDIEICAHRGQQRRGICKQHVGGRPCQCRQCHARLRIFEIAHIDRHRLCPAEVANGHHNEAADVNMAERIEAQPPGTLCRPVAEPVCDKPVRSFMKRDAKQRRRDHDRRLPDGVKAELLHPCKKFFQGRIFLLSRFKQYNTAFSLLQGNCKEKTRRVCPRRGAAKTAAAFAPWGARHGGFCILLSQRQRLCAQYRETGCPSSVSTMLPSTTAMSNRCVCGGVL